MTAAEYEPAPALQHVEIRSAATGTTIAEVNIPQRIITMVAVPYEESGEVMIHGQVWNEVFSRSAFDGIEKRPQRIRINREHVIGNTVGKAIRFDPSSREGLVAEVKIANTVGGSDTLALAADDCLSPSIGYIARPSQVTMDRNSMIRRVNTAWLDHIALVEHPTFNGAAIIDVRHAFGQDARQGPPVETPLLEDFMADPIVRRALGLES